MGSMCFAEACNNDRMAAKAAKKIDLPSKGVKLPHDHTWDADGDAITIALSTMPMVSDDISEGIRSTKL